MDPLTTPARSWLFVPATRHDRFAKAAASGADRVIIDLEDAVATDEKPSARDALVGLTMPENVLVYVRINGPTTPWFKDDLAVAASLAISGILLPKAETGGDVVQAGVRLPQSKRIVPIIETAAGAWNMLAVARAPKVERLVFGSLDFQLDTGMQDEGDTLAFVRSQVVIASRVAGIGAPIDSVSLAIDDDDALTRDAARSRRFGFAGKLCIHPKQLPAANGAFRPSVQEVEWARGLLTELAARLGDAVFAYRGGLVDRPVIERAKRIESEARAAGDLPP